MRQQEGPEGGVSAFRGPEPAVWHWQALSDIGMALKKCKGGAYGGSHSFPGNTGPVEWQKQAC